MHYSSISSSNFNPPIYTDRTFERNTPLDGSWVKNNHPHPHLNPSKSKLNVKQFLNRSGEGSSLSHPNIDNLKGSCFMANPPRPHQHRQSFFEDKYSNASKIKHDMSFQLVSKDSYPKFNYTPTALDQHSDRKKSQSTFLRSSLREGYNSIRPEEEKETIKEDKAIAEIRSQILSLTKKVFMNEEEIHKLKDRENRQKRSQTFEQQFTQFQIQMFDICKKNTNYFSEFEDKIERNSRLLGEIKDRCNDLVNKDSEREDLSKRLSSCQTKIADLCDTIRLREDLTIKNIAAQFNTEETMMKKYVNEQLADFKLKAQKASLERSDTIAMKLSQLEEDLFEKRIEEYFKKDSKKAYNSLTIQTKEYINVREGEPIRDRTNRFINQQTSSSKKQFGYSQSDIKINSRQKEQNLLKQCTYYIDPFGYLLDENQYYLLNSKNERITIPGKLMSCLKENNMLVLNGSRI